MTLAGWEYLDDEKTKWILQQAEAKLASTYAVSCALDQKVSALRTISLTLLTAIIGYGFSHLSSDIACNLANLRPPLWLLISGTLAAASVLILLFDSMSKEFYGVGTSPQSLMNTTYLSMSFAEMLQGYIKEIDRRIAFNITRNDKRGRSMDGAVAALTLSPIVGALIAVWP